MALDIPQTPLAKGISFAVLRGIFRQGILMGFL
jgi:hypothetical protein